MFECEICQETFPSRNKLFQHVKDHSSDNRTNGGRELSVKEQVWLPYEDENCKVICKPQGIPTMGAKYGENLYKHPLLLIPERFKPGGKYRKAVPAHRLDSATGGLIMCSKSHDDAVLINQCFRKKLVLKRYVSIIPGELDLSKGMISSVIEGKEALTYFEIQSTTPSLQYGKISLIYLWPITGRKHQLRKQLKQLGCPIIADPRFSSAVHWPRDQAFHRLFLWAIEIHFPDLQILKSKFPQLLLPTILDEDTLDEEDEGGKEKMSDYVAGVDENDHDDEKEGSMERKARIIDIPRWLEERNLLANLSTTDFSISLYYQHILSLYQTKYLTETKTVSIPIPEYYARFQAFEQQDTVIK